METVLNREIVVSRAAGKIAGGLLFLILTVLGGFVRIPLPFTPVPITLQTLFVLLSGAFLGGRLSGCVQLSYIILGIAGIPIFTNAGFGLVYVLGPTGGYLLGFILAGLFTGKFIKYAGAAASRVFAVFCLADFILLASGMLRLKAVLGCSLNNAFLIGFVPFIYADLAKIFAATFIYLRFSSYFRSKNS